MHAYRAAPEKGGPCPTVPVAREIFGVHEHVGDVCRRLAKFGYLAVAPELYSRQGEVSKLAMQDIVGTVASKVPDARVMGGLDATAAWAKKDGHGDAAKPGVTGFCRGGRIVWLYAAPSKDATAGVAWYGRLSAAGKATDVQPKYPIDLAADIEAPVPGLYGEKDTGIPVPDVEALRAALEKADEPGEIVLAPDAPPAFRADYRPSDRKEPAGDGWKACGAWFKTNGVAGPAGGRPDVPIACFSLDPDVARGADHGDGNATAMSRANGKLRADYRRLASTSAFLSELSSDVGIPTSALVEVRRGGVVAVQGTRVNSDAVIHRAQRPRRGSPCRGRTGCGCGWRLRVNGR